MGVVDEVTGPITVCVINLKGGVGNPIRKRMFFGEAAKKRLAEASVVIPMKRGA